MKYYDIYSEDGYIIGTVVGAIFFKPVYSSRGHQLFSPPAWSIDVFAVEQAKFWGAKIIIVVDFDTNTAYMAYMDTFDRYKGTLNRGFNEQYFLTLNYWNMYII